MDELTIKWGGESYTAGQLTAADVIAMEDEWGESFQSIDMSSMKAVCWLVWLVRRHNEPGLSFDDVTAITMAAMADDAEDAKLPPTRGSSKPAKRSGASGGRGTKRSTA